MLSEAILNRPHRCPLPAELTREEAALYTLAAESLPVSDLCSMAPETILSYVRHALFLRETAPSAGNCRRAFSSTMCSVPGSIPKILWTAAGFSTTGWHPGRRGFPPGRPFWR